MKRLVFITLVLSFILNITLFAETSDTLPFLENETINYKVKLRGITIGKASITYKGTTELDGRKVHQVIFYTDTANFKDREIMYADIDNFLPIRIERDVNNWGKKEQIIEEYDQENHSVKITWLGKKRDKAKFIQKDDKIQNVILSIFLHRKSGDLEIGKSFSITLPLRKVVMRVTRRDRIRVPSGTYDTYRLESFPGGHKIWFEASGKAIPVRISGPFFLGSVNMVMIDYEGVENVPR